MADNGVMSRSSADQRAARRAAFFSLVLLTTALVASSLFAGFRPAVIELGDARLPALPLIFAGLGLPAVAVFGVRGQRIPTLCFAGAGLAALANALWYWTSVQGGGSSGKAILHAALLACALGLSARGLLLAREQNAPRSVQRT